MRAFSIAFSASRAELTTSTMHFESSIRWDFLVGVDSERARSRSVCVRVVAVERWVVLEGVAGVVGERGEYRLGEGWVCGRKEGELGLLEVVAAVVVVDHRLRLVHLRHNVFNHKVRH